MPPVILGLAGVFGAGAGLGLTGWTRGAARRVDSRWLRPWVLATLAGLGGCGAAALAHDVFELVAFLVLAIACALLIAIDMAEERLPDAIVGRAYVAFGLLLLITAIFSGHWARFGRATLAGAVVFAIYFALAWVNPSGLYFGDVKLSGLLGLFLGWFGWAQVITGITAGFVLSAMVGLSLLVSRRGNRTTEYPFGPLMILGAAIGAGWGAVVLPRFA